MIEHIPELVNAGIDSFKIEGRMKTALYVATVAGTYRKAIDDFFESPEKYVENLPLYRENISKCTYRNFTTGFFFNKPGADAQVYDNNVYVREYIYYGSASEINSGGLAVMEQKNKFSVGDTLEIMHFDGTESETKVLDILDEDGNHMPSCPHARQTISVRFSVMPAAGEIIRGKGPDENPDENR
jgi:putative protease